MSRAVLFDLEGTLVDVTSVSELREQRRWQEYVANVDRTRLFPGVREMMEELRAQGVLVGIVTNVPSMLADALIAHHRLPYDAKICYHDVPRGMHKPHHAMCTKALSALGVVRERAVGVGDRSADMGSFHSAGIPSYCAGWNESAETGAGWDVILGGPTDLLKRLPPKA